MTIDDVHKHVKTLGHNPMLCRFSAMTVSDKRNDPKPEVFGYVVRVRRSEWIAYLCGQSPRFWTFRNESDAVDVLTSFYGYEHPA